MSANDDQFEKTVDAHGSCAPSAGSGTGDPRIGGISREEAAMLKQLAESMGALDSMPAWMRDEIEAKTKSPNADFRHGSEPLPARTGSPTGRKSNA